MGRTIRRLYRASTEGRIAGVCAGLGDYLEIDPVLVRLLWLVVTIFTGFAPGIVAYLVAWLIVPEEPQPAWQPDPARPSSEDASPSSR